MSVTSEYFYKLKYLGIKLMNTYYFTYDSEEVLLSF